ncbi:extended synaptotagmin-1, partial [Melozone crissalis]|uniref:extended synaptotagmin-1 n=1 Tax=Melozone crissalis TaxID=40204 RepID=UPI0023DCBC23
MERRSGLGLAALGALGRRLLWALPAYAAGLLGLGAGAVVLALALYAGWRRRRRARERGMRAAERLHREEEAAVRAAARGELPAWVSFPDVERAEWLNKVLAQAWPFLGQYLEKLLTDSVAPAIRASSPHLQSFTFTRVDLGQKPLRVLGVQAHPGTHKKQILLDLNISYVGDVQIDVEVKKFFCKAGVKGMQLHGVLRIILEPLLGDVPIVGALSMFFIRRPTLDINWTGMTNLLDIPGLSSMSDSMIMDSIASYLVLPNRLLVPLLPDLPEAARLRWPLPRGVVRVSLVAARALRSKDRFLGGLVQGRSDPYALLRVGTQAATSRVIGDSLEPEWDEMYEFMVHEVPGQELEVELYDKDPDKDDLLGRMKLDLGEVLRARVMDEWFPLQDGGQGRLHLRLEWLSLLSDASKLDQVLEKNQKIVAKPDPPSSAILVVYLDRAEGLPVRKAGKEPNPVVQVSVQDVTRESKVVCNTSAPVWEDAFRFFLHDPRNQDVDFQVKDDPRQSPLGSLSLPLSRLLQSPSLSLSGPFPLQRSGPGALLHLQMELGPARPPPAQAEPPKSDTEGAPPRPSQAGPDPRAGTERVLRVHLLEAEALMAQHQRLGGGVPVLPVIPRVLRVHLLEAEALMAQHQRLGGGVPVLPVPRGGSGLSRVHLLEAEALIAKDQRLGGPGVPGGFRAVREGFGAVSVLRVHLLEAEALIAKDQRLGGPGVPGGFRAVREGFGAVSRVLRVHLLEAEALIAKDQRLRGPGVPGGFRAVREGFGAVSVLRVHLLEAEALIAKDQRLGGPGVPGGFRAVREGFGAVSRVLRVHLLEAEALIAKDQRLRGPGVPGGFRAVRVRGCVHGSVRGCVRGSVRSPPVLPGSQRVLRVHLLEAEALIAKDQRLGGLVRGRSDPYAQVRAGGSRFRSRVIKEELNPRWNEIYEVIVDDVPGQDVEFDLFDKDIDKDDFLG